MAKNFISDRRIIVVAADAVPLSADITKEKDYMAKIIQIGRDKMLVTPPYTRG